MSADLSAALSAVGDWSWAGASSPVPRVASDDGQNTERQAGKQRQEPKKQAKPVRAAARSKKAG